MTAEHDTDTPEPRLNSTEIRILGCLIEKQATNPETYPLTLNALLLALLLALYTFGARQGSTPSASSNCWTRAWPLPQRSF